MMSADDFRRAMASFAAGVTVIATRDEAGAPQAVTATAFSSLSLAPPLCLVCIGRHTRTHRPLRANGRFAVNVLAAGQERLSARFASAVADRFAAVEWAVGEASGCPLLAGALAWIECQVVEVVAGGDHDIFIGAPLSVRVHDGAPLVYFRGGYGELARPSQEGRIHAAATAGHSQR
jgi:flavin reductase (DIM6/NTAB) family NADH-FMN oxidoreductase RutF